MSHHTQISGQPYELLTPDRYGGILVVTANDIPGYEIEKIHGTVYGITVRSRNLGANIGAGLKSLVGGELRSLTKNVITSRDEAVDRMITGARNLGANAVFAFRFDCGTLAEGITEICCYGTACTVREKEKLL
jgi:uncharacterized protein YbjQ (UPF0145 family)